MSFEHKKASEMADLSPPWPAGTRLLAIDPTEAEAKNRNKVINPNDIGIKGIAAQNNGAAVSGGPFHTLNLVNGGAADAGGNVLDLTISVAPGSGSDLTQVVVPADSDYTIADGEHAFFDLSSMTAERTATWPVGSAGVRFRVTTYGRHATLGLLTDKNGGALLNQDPIFGALVGVGTFQFNGSSTATSGTNFTFGGGLVNCTGEVTANGVCQITLPVTYKVGSTIFGTGTFSAISSSSMNHADAVSFASSNNEHVTYNRERSDGSGRLPTTPAMLFLYCPDDVSRIVNGLTYECRYISALSKWVIELISVSKIL